MTRARTLSLLGNENNFTVTGSNNVGIGSTLPDGKLDVGGDIVVGTAITISSVSGIISATDFYVDGISITGAAGTWATFTSGGEGGISTTKKVKIENGLEVTGISTFSGALTVGGVLTYDDVTNVDSIGIITARSDVSIAENINHIGDTNTRIRFPAADTFTVDTAGTERVRVGSAGSVGIGTDTLSCLVNVVGSVLSAESTGGTVLIKQKGDTNNDGITITSSSPNSGRIFKDADGKLHIYNTGTGNANQFILDNSTGNVGINSLSPTETFDIDSGGTPTTMKIRSNTQSSILFDDVGGSPKQYRIGTNINGNNGQFEIYDDTSDESRLVVGTAGSFGLNNTNPLEVLHVKFTSTNSSTRTTLGSQVTDCGLKIENEANADNNYAGLFMRAGNADAKLFAERASSDTANLRIVVDNGGTGTERLRIKGSDGRIGVSNNDPVEAFHIKYDTDSSGTRTNTGGGHVGCGLKVENTNSTTNSYAGIFLRSNDADIKINCVRPAANRSDLELIMDNGSTGTKYLTIEGADGDILPGSDNSQDLGSSSLRWANIYSADLQLSNEGMGNDVDGTWGQYTIQEGENDLFLLNRRNGKKYRFMLEEVN